jgi:hypothetical protein
VKEGITGSRDHRRLEPDGWRPQAARDERRDMRFAAVAYVLVAGVQQTDRRPSAVRARRSGELDGAPCVTARARRRVSQPRRHGSGRCGAAPQPLSSLPWPTAGRRRSICCGSGEPAEEGRRRVRVARAGRDATAPEGARPAGKEWRQRSIWTET